MVADKVCLQLVHASVQLDKALEQAESGQYLTALVLVDVVVALLQKSRCSLAKDVCDLR